MTTLLLYFNSLQWALMELWDICDFLERYFSYLIKLYIILSLMLVQAYPCSLRSGRCCCCCVVVFFSSLLFWQPQCVYKPQSAKKHSVWEKRLNPLCESFLLAGECLVNCSPSGGESDRMGRLPDRVCRKMQPASVWWRTLYGIISTLKWTH